LSKVCFGDLFRGLAIHHDMAMNSGKTTKMIMSRIHVSDLPPLCTRTGKIQRVHSFKMLGVYMPMNL